MLKMVSKAACKMELPKARHGLKNHCFTHYGVTQSRNQPDLSNPMFILETEMLGEFEDLNSDHTASVTTSCISG